MTSKWESPEIAYWDGFGDGRKVGNVEKEASMMYWLGFVAIAMFMVGLTSGIMWF